MSKITLTDVGSGYQTATQQNANNDSIETHLNDKVLYRDNPTGEPNTMQQELDMNSNQLTNVTSPNNASDAATKGYVDNLISGTTDAGSAQLRIDLASDANTEGASLVGIEDSAATFAATTVEGALAELVTESVALAGTQTITGDKTLSGTTELSGATTLSGTNILSGATTISGATVLSGATTDVSGTQTNSAIVKWAKGADLTNTDVDVSNILTVGTDGNYFDYTGTDQIDAIATFGVGTVIKIHFDAICTLTHHATNFILIGAADITTAAGDEAEIIEYASGDCRLLNYQRASSGNDRFYTGEVVQVVHQQDGVVATGSNNIDADNSVPQITTDGDEFLSVAITPKDTNNILIIEAKIHLASTLSAAHQFIAALFQDADANALAVSMVTRVVAAANTTMPVSLTYYMTAGTIVSTTFRVHGGTDLVGTTTFNGQSGAQFFGGVYASSITVTEIKG